MRKLSDAFFMFTNYVQRKTFAETAASRSRSIVSNALACVSRLGIREEEKKLAVIGNRRLMRVVITPRRLRITRFPSQPTRILTGDAQISDLNPR